MHSRTHPGPRRARGTPALLLLLGAAAGLVAWQLTPHSVRRTSLDGFPAAPDWTPLTTAEAALHRETAVAACERQLQEIGRAMARYQHDRHRLPDQLSDLVPRYLPERSVLHCPADPTPGAPGLPELHQDPRLPISYSYEASADPCGPVEPALGPLFPASDIPDSEYPGQLNCGTCRHVNEYQQTFFGGMVPVVRCLHHPGADDEDWVLNLSLDGHVYPSAWGDGPAPFDSVRLGWRNRPEVIDAALARFERDLAAGPAKLQRRWDLQQLLMYVDSWKRDDMGPRLRAIRPRLRSVAGRLLAVAPKLPDVGGPGQPTVQQWMGHDEGLPASRKRLAAEMAAKLYVMAGEYRRAAGALAVARRLPPSDRSGDLAELSIRPDIARGLGEREKEIAALQPFVVEPRDLSAGPIPVPPRLGTVNRLAMERLAEVEEALGRPERAAHYRLLADPIRGLIGQPAPEFTLPTASGRPVALRSARRGKRAVLLVFWAAGKPGFQGELPYLQELHDRLQDKGFELITILLLYPAGGTLSTPAGASLPAPIALQADTDDVEQAYHVHQYPTLVLIDAGGRVAWYAEGLPPARPGGTARGAGAAGAGVMRRRWPARAGWS